MASEPFEFISTAGYRLRGRLELSEAPLRGWSVFAHCFTCGKDGLAAVRLGQALALLGISTLRFDFAGIGASEGRFADTSCSADGKDLVAAGEAMVTAGMPTVGAVATTGAPADVAHVLNHVSQEGLTDIEADGEAKVMLATRPIILRRTFVEDARSHRLETDIAALNRPLLVLHAPRDGTVGIEGGNRIFLAAKHPKSFVSLGEADHLLNRRADAEYVTAIIAAWATPYLGARSVPAA